MRIGIATNRINTVTEDDDRLSSVNTLEDVGQGQDHRIIKSSTVPGPNLLETSLDRMSFIGEVCQKRNFLAEGHERYSVLRLQLIQKTPRGLAHQPNFPLSAPGSIEHQGDIERDRVLGKESDLLFF